MKIISQKIKSRYKLDSKLLFKISPFKEVIKTTTTLIRRLLLYN